MVPQSTANRPAAAKRDHAVFLCTNLVQKYVHGVIMPPGRVWHDDPGSADNNGDITATRMPLRPLYLTQRTLAVTVYIGNTSRSGIFAASKAATLSM